MKNQKGISAWAVVLIIALLIGAGLLWSKYFAKPAAEVMMQGADQAKPAIERAHQASDVAEQAGKMTEEAAKQINGDTENR